MLETLCVMDCLQRQGNRFAEPCRFLALPRYPAASLSAFALAHERLGLADAPGEVRLGQSCFFAGLAQVAKEHLVFLRVDGLAHTLPTASGDDAGGEGRIVQNRLLMSGGRTGGGPVCMIRVFRGR